MWDNSTTTEATTTMAIITKAVVLEAGMADSRTTRRRPKSASDRHRQKQASIENLRVSFSSYRSLTHSFPSLVSFPPPSTKPLRLSSQLDVWWTLSPLVWLTDWASRLDHRRLLFHGISWEQTINDAESLTYLLTYLLTQSTHDNNDDGRSVRLLLLSCTTCLHSLRTNFFTEVSSWSQQRQ